MLLRCFAFGTSRLKVRLTRRIRAKFVRLRQELRRPCVQKTRRSSSTSCASALSACVSSSRRISDTAASADNASSGGTSCVLPRKIVVVVVVVVSLAGGCCCCGCSLCCSGTPGGCKTAAEDSSVDDGCIWPGRLIFTPPGPTLLGGTALPVVALTYLARATDWIARRRFLRSRLR